MIETSGRNHVGSWTAADLATVYNDMTGSIRFHCRFVTAIVGGQPAGDEELRQFITHHLKLEGEPADEAFQRIRTFEIGGRETNQKEGELKEEEVYAVKTFRKSRVSLDGVLWDSPSAPVGPWLGDWMVKGCIKQAASRSGLFVAKHGSKGDIAEGGCVRAVGMSLRDPAAPERIFVCAPGGILPAETHFEKFMGRVNTPQGSRSIFHHSEVIDPGAEFECELRFLPGRIFLKQLKEVCALMGNIGLGSVKAMERGKFEIVNAEVFGVREEPEKKAKEKTSDREPEALSGAALRDGP